MEMNPIRWNLENLELNLNEGFKPTAVTSCKAKNSRRGALPLFHTDSKNKKTTKKSKLEGAKSKRELNPKNMRLVCNRPSSTQKFKNVKMTTIEGNRNHIDTLYRDSIDQTTLSKTKLKTSHTNSSRINRIYVPGNIPKVDSQPFLKKKRTK